MPGAYSQITRIDDASLTSVDAYCHGVWHAFSDSRALRPLPHWDTAPGESAYRALGVALRARGWGRLRAARRGSGPPTRAAGCSLSDALRPALAGSGLGRGTGCRWGV